VIRLTKPATGHEVRTDDASVDFWLAAGYVRQEAEKKPTPSRRASKKSSK
jgi:hypothetical protein